MNCKNRTFIIVALVKLKRYIFLFLLLGGVACKDSSDVELDEAPYVILVSFDGFRSDYVEQFNAPNFKKFISKGSSATALISSFPSKTFPNHYSIVTGLYPENHGLVDNTFFDPGRGTTYRIGDRSKVEDEYYYDGLPLWQLAQQNDMKSASFFWVGSEAPIAGSHPDYFRVFDSSVPNESRIDTVVDWLALPKAERPQFITLYFSLVDSEGHATGPDSEETKQTVLEADRLLGVLMSKVEESPLNINVILTSDHGMYKMQNGPDTFIYNEEIFAGLDMTDARVVSNGTHIHLFIDNPGLAHDLFDIVKARENRFSIYRKEETPEVWHYRNSDRIGDFILMAEPGHKFTTRPRSAGNPETRSVWGDHGFDPYNTPEMLGIFYAQGPNIKQGATVPAFENIHIYPFIANLLGIQNLPPIDGTSSVLESILSN